MRRRTVIGLAAVAVAGLVTTAGAVGLGGHGRWRAGFVQRMVSTALDEALDQAQVTAEQRVGVHAARDRVFATVDQARSGRRAHLEEALRLFEADTADLAQVEVLHREAEAERQHVRDAVHQALVEVHALLTPAQRRAVAGYVRSHGGGMFH